MQIGFYFDQCRCTGCYTRIVACKDWHDVPCGPVSWMRVKSIERGKYPDLFLAYLICSCYHCSEPGCLSACPANAINKREQDGIVLVDGEKCLGKDSCDMCLRACLYSAPQFGVGQHAKMQKCDFCLGRLAENKKPICVDACPMRALDVGPLDELRAKYGDIRQAEGFAYSEKVIPSIIFKPKKDAKGRSVRKVEVIPHAEKLQG